MTHVSLAESVVPSHRCDGAYFNLLGIRLHVQLVPDHLQCSFLSGHLGFDTLLHY